MESLTGMNIYAVRLLLFRLALVKHCFLDAMADQHGSTCWHLASCLCTHLLGKRRQSQIGCFTEPSCKHLHAWPRECFQHIEQHLSAVPCGQPD